MKILMLLEGVFPQDERVEKEIASLIAAGHSVRIATYSFQKTHFVEEYQGYTIYRKYISSLIYKFSAAILVLPFYFSFWRKFIAAIYKEWQFDAIHIHDLPLARLGSEFKRKHKVVFVADQHEFYSDWIVKTAHYNTFLGKIVRSLSNWKRYERTHLHHADLVCTVEEPIKKLYLNQHKIDKGKVIVIPNTPLKSIYSVKAKPRVDNSFILFYCGGLDMLRGLETPIRALKILRDSIPEIKVSLVGKVNKHFDPLAFAKELGVGDLVEFRGWVHYKDLPNEIDQSDICFFTPPANRDEINNTIATKIYQYMARAKPVIVGKALYMKEFVEQNDIGIAVDEESPEEFAAAVIEMYESKKLISKYADNAEKNMDKYYWDNTIRGLVSFYNNKD